MSCVRINGKVARAATRFLSREKARPVLGNAQIRGGNLVASNGRLLLDMPLPDQDSDPQDDVSGHDPWLLPPDVLKLPKASQHLVVDLQTGEVVLRDRHGAAVASMSRLEHGDSEGRYPDYRQVIPDTEPVARVAVQAGYLRAVADLVDASTSDHLSAVVLELTDGTEVPAGRAVRFRRRLEDGDGDVLGLVMPCHWWMPPGTYRPKGNGEDS